MKENAEYCTNQAFFVVHVSDLLNYRLWQCERCAYTFSQKLLSNDPPVIPFYHPKPIPIRFSVTDEQIEKLRNFLEE